MTIHLIVSALAGWRIASLLVNESGPWDVFLRLRQRLGADQDGTFFDTAPFWHGLFSCVWCMTVWVVPLAWAAWYLEPAIPGIVAAMGLAIVVESAVKR